MKFKVKKQDVIEGLQKASAIIPSKAGAAYLRSVWLEATDGSLSIMATDADMEFTGKYPAEVEEPGLCGVQGRAFVDLAKLLPDGELEFSTDEEQTNLRLKQGKRNYKFAMRNKDWFQAFSQFPEENAMTWAGDIFGDYIERVLFCITDEQTQEGMNCLCVKPIGNGRIDICGLNGHQFAKVTFTYDELEARLPKDGLLIQKKFLGDIKKWLGQDEIELNFTDKRLYLRSSDGRETLSVPRASYEYPDYNIFMAKFAQPTVSRLQVNRKEMMDSLGRVLLFNNEVDRCFMLDLGKDEIKVSASGADLGSAKETLDAEYDGDIKRVSFPTRGFIEILSHFASQDASMTFTSVEGPCAVTGPEDPDYTVVVMPMRVSANPWASEDGDASDSGQSETDDAPEDDETF